MLKQFSKPIRSIFRIKSRLLFSVEAIAGFSSQAVSPAGQKNDKLRVLYTHHSYHNCKLENKKFFPIFSLLVFSYNTFTAWNIYNTLFFCGAFTYELFRYLVINNQSKMIIYCIQCDPLLQNLYITVPNSLYAFALEKQYGAGITPQQKKDLIDNYHPTHKTTQKQDQKLKQIQFNKLQKNIFRLKFPTKDVKMRSFLLEPKSKQTKKNDTQKQNSQFNKQGIIYLNIDYLSEKNPKTKGRAMIPFKINLGEGLPNPYQNVLKSLMDGQIQLAFAELQKGEANEQQKSRQSKQAQKKQNQ